MNECSLKKMERNISQVTQKPIYWEFKRFSLLGERITQYLQMLPDFIGQLLKTLPACYAFYLLSDHFQFVSADCIGLGFKSLNPAMNL